ncbi:hypothetical protein ACROYT_G032402 [Oculina patagonica]
MAVRSICLALLLTATLVIAADKEVGSGGVIAKVRGSSGKVEFGRKGSGGKFDQTKAFTLEVDYVTQLDKDFKEVGKKVNNLASQEFTFSPLKQNAVYQNLSAVNLNLDAFLTAAKAWLKLEVYIFKEAGNVTFGDEVFQVQNGTLKLLIKLENYTFCEGDAIASICKNNDVGKYVDVAIVVKSKGGKAPKKRGDSEKGKIKCVKKGKCPNIFSFGDEADMALTKTVIRDGMVEASPSGYPKADDQGGKQRFIFRVSKFNSTAIFDPTVSVSDAEDEPETPTKALASSIQLNVAMFVVMLVALFM